MYDLIARHILAPVLDFSRGPKIWRYIKELEKSQWWPRGKILALQDERLRRLVRYAYKNVPYYRHIFDERSLKPDDIVCSADLVKLPVLTKQIIRKNFDQLKARGFPLKKTVLVRTGGSTGEPLVFYTTKDEQRNWDIAKSRRAQGWWGYKVGDKCALIIKRPHISTLERFRRFLEGRTIFIAMEMGHTLPLSVKKLEEFQPKFIAGYPNAIYLVAQFIERRGKTKLKPKAVITVSEQLYDFQKELFRKVFGCETYNVYSAWETKQIGAECSEHSGYHIAAESVIVEIVNGEGGPVPAGSEGRILITNLHNYAMPLIRYDMGDVGALSALVCPCGRGLPLLSRLSGRTTDFLITKSGSKIPGMALDFRPLASAGVEQFQIVQENYGEVIFKIVPTGKYRREHGAELTRKIIVPYKSMLGEDMDIIVKFVDRIPVTREGKRRVVVSKLTVPKDE